AVEPMHQPHAESHAPGEEQALGWTVRRWGDEVCLAQDADTFGQRAFLRVVPARRLALCVLANSPTGGALGQQLIERVASDLLDAPTGESGGAVVDVTGNGNDGGHVGVYDRLHQRITVAAPAGSPVLATEPSGMLQALGVRDAELPLRPLDHEGRVFVTTD